MKKCILSIFLLFLLCFCCLSCKEKNDSKENSLYLSYFNQEEINFIKENDISENDLIPYLSFSSFNILNFFEYEKVRKEKNLSYLQALNTINYPNYFEKYYLPKPFVFSSSYLALVNKAFYLDSSYIPKNLISLKDTNISYIKRENENMQADKYTLEKYKKLEKEAKSLGFNLYVFSAYRSYEKQEHIYYVINNKNDNTVARPGFSEHQLGYSLDISTLKYGLTNHFENSEEFKWLKNNVHKFGFILRYPKEKESITGYSYEAWHFRFVGESVAEFIYNNNLTLEEYIFNYLEIK